MGGGSPPNSALEHNLFVLTAADDVWGLITTSAEVPAGWAGALPTSLTTAGPTPGPDVAGKIANAIEYLEVRWGRGKVVLDPGRYFFDATVVLSNYTGIGGAQDPTVSTRLAPNSPTDPWTIGPLIVVGPNISGEAIRLPAVGGFIENLWAIPSTYPRAKPFGDYAGFTRYILDIQKHGAPLNGVGVLLGYRETVTAARGARAENIYAAGLEWVVRCNNSPGIEIRNLIADCPLYSLTSAGDIVQVMRAERFPLANNGGPLNPVTRRGVPASGPDPAIPFTIAAFTGVTPAKVSISYPTNLPNIQPHEVVRVTGFAFLSAAVALEQAAIRVNATTWYFPNIDWNASFAGTDTSASAAVTLNMSFAVEAIRASIPGEPNAASTVGPDGRPVVAGQRATVVTTRTAFPAGIAIAVGDYLSLNAPPDSPAWGFGGWRKVLGVDAGNRRYTLDLPWDDVFAGPAYAAALATPARGPLMLSILPLARRGPHFFIQDVDSSFLFGGAAKSGEGADVRGALAQGIGYNYEGPATGEDAARDPDIVGLTFGPESDRGYFGPGAVKLGNGVVFSAGEGTPPILAAYELTDGGRGAIQWINGSGFVHLPRKFGETTRIRVAAGITGNNFLAIDSGELLPTDVFARLGDPSIPSASLRRVTIANAVTTQVIVGAFGNEIAAVRRSLGTHTWTTVNDLGALFERVRIAHDRTVISGLLLVDAPSEDGSAVNRGFLRAELGPYGTLARFSQQVSLPQSAFDLQAVPGDGGVIASPRTSRVLDIDVIARNATPVLTITRIAPVGSTGRIRLTTNAAHGYAVNDIVTIDGVSNTAITNPGAVNGTRTIAAVTSSLTFDIDYPATLAAPITTFLGTVTIGQPSDFAAWSKRVVLRRNDSFASAALLPSLLSSIAPFESTPDFAGLALGVAVNTSTAALVLSISPPTSGLVRRLVLNVTATVNQRP